jgi:hypothetical protein
VEGQGSLEQGIVHPVFRQEPVSDPAQRRRHSEQDQRRERPQRVWFAALAVLAEIGGLVTLSAVSAHQFVRRA